jgi:hypothetical protein
MPWPAYLPRKESSMTRRIGARSHLGGRNPGRLCGALLSAALLTGGCEPSAPTELAAPSGAHFSEVSRTVSFTSTPPNPAYVGDDYLVTASSVIPGDVLPLGSNTPSVCAFPENTYEAPATVSFVAAGTCTLTVACTHCVFYDFDVQTFEVQARWTPGTPGGPVTPGTPPGQGGPWGGSGPPQ